MAETGYGGLSPEEFSNIRQELDTLRKSFISVSQSLQQTVAANREALAGVSTSYTKTANIVKDLSTQLSEDLKTLKGQKKIDQDIRTLRKEILQTENTILYLREKMKTATREEMFAIFEALKATTTQKEILEETVIEAQKFKKEIILTTKKLLIFNKLADTIKSIPGLGPLISGPFEKAADAAKNAAEQGEDLFTVYKKGFGELLVSAGSLISVVAVTKTLLEATDQAKELSVSLGISQSSAFELQKTFTQYANSTQNAKITTQELVKAQLELQKQSQLGAVFSGKTLENFIELTQYLGVSTEAASKLTLLQQSLGDTSGEYLNNIAESVVLAGKALKVNIPLSEAYESIAGASAETIISLQRNPQLLAQTLIQAKKIGAEFRDLEKISSSLLDFESSIRAELEAEILTGKQLNLEQARIAAITGDRKALAEELATQIGTAAEFEQMSAIAKESYAKTLGLTVDDMATMLLRQDAINTLGKDAENLTDQQLQSARALVNETTSLGEALRQVNQEASATQEFELAAKQIQQAFQKIVLEAAPLVKKVSSVVSSFLASGLGKMVTVGGAGIALALKAMSTIRGAFPTSPMYVKEVGAGIGSGWFNKGKFYGGGQYLPGGGRAPKGGTVIGRGLTTRGMMGIGGGLAGMALTAASSQVENPYLSNAMQYGGMGMMIGSTIAPGIGTAIGTAVGSGVGLIIGYLQDKEQREEQKEKEREKRDVQFQDTLQRLAMKEAKIYMDSVEVGRTMVDNTPQY